MSQPAIAVEVADIKISTDNVKTVPQNALPASQPPSALLVLQATTSTELIVSSLLLNSDQLLYQSVQSPREVTQLSSLSAPTSFPMDCHSLNKITSSPSFLPQLTPTMLPTSTNGLAQSIMDV